jgi:hypothetical protein
LAAARLYAFAGGGGDGRVCRTKYSSALMGRGERMKSASPVTNMSSSEPLGDADSQFQNPAKVCELVHRGQICRRLRRPCWLNVGAPACAHSAHRGGSFDSWNRPLAPASSERNVTTRFEPRFCCGVRRVLVRVLPSRSRLPMAESCRRCVSHRPSRQGHPQV